MQIQSMPPSWERPRQLAGKPVPSRPRQQPEPPDPELGEQIARWVGRGSQAVAMAPQFLESRPWVLDTLRLGTCAPLLEGAAVAAGAVSTVSMATAGTLEVIDGVKHRNAAEVFKGASEIARGGYVGTFTASLLADRSLDFGRGLGIVSGGLQTLGGLARMTQQKKPGNPTSPKVVGALEAGMGLSWLGSLVGVPVGLCFTLRMGLSASKAIYTHRQDWQDWTLQKGRG